MKLNKGDKVSNFTLQDTKGDNVELKDLAKGSKVLILFFPLAFSSTCTEELCQTRDNMKFYNSLSTTVVGISVDSFFTLREFKKANNLNFTLLSDFNKEVSKQFGAIYEDYFGMKGVSKRASFIVNDQHEIEYVEVLDDSGKLPDFKSIQKALS
ncbi:redoxin domain-containing protein [Rhodohalobacter barkolensis]|uniref:Peroxiredoxin n=1 Tax=Rhodohalobacter barkolensis TaxID=2053187 RepID=A0A2N0VK39_9BACT|nr:redoxin domain-containing protein [Rhodohalobacter barkolensis]PKD44540.1 peroxiredoxin [Rhodohalobacter barkolensis]